MSRNDPVLEVLSATLIQKKLPGIRLGVVTNSKNDGVWLSGAFTTILLFILFYCSFRSFEFCMPTEITRVLFVKTKLFNHRRGEQPWLLKRRMTDMTIKKGYGWLADNWLENRDLHIRTILVCANFVLLEHNLKRLFQMSANCEFYWKLQIRRKRNTMPKLLITYRSVESKVCIVLRL